MKKKRSTSMRLALDSVGDCSGRAVVLGLALALLIARAAPDGHAQSPLHAQHGAALSRAQMVREIDDPHTGERWLLVRDPDCPAGPGRMLAAGTTDLAGIVPPLSSPVDPVPGQALVIRAGERVTVEEDSVNLKARLEAVALGNASTGAPLKVRFVLGGRVVPVTAIGRGRAILVAPAGGWR